MPPPPHPEEIAEQLAAMSWRQKVAYADQVLARALVDGGLEDLAEFCLAASSGTGRRTGRNFRVVQPPPT